MKAATGLKVDSRFLGRVEGSARARSRLDFQHYLRILRKYKLPIVVFSLLVTLLAAYYANTTTPEYRASASLLIESQGSTVPTIDELVSSDTESQGYYQTQLALLSSRMLATRVVGQLDLWDHPELSPRIRNELAIARRLESGVEESGLLSNAKSFFSSLSKAPRSGPVISATEEKEVIPKLRRVSELNKDQKIVVRSFMNRLTVAPVRGTKLVTLEYLSADPVLAALVANTVGEQYIESYLEAKLDRTKTAAVFFNTRLSDLKSTLDLSKEALIQFKEDNNLVDVGGSVERLNEQELLLDTAELAEARNDLATQRSVFNEVQSLRGQTSLLESIPAIQADPLVQRTKIEQGQAQRQLDELLNRYGDRHPRVVDSKSQLETLNKTLEGQVALVIGGIANDYELARDRVRSLEAKLASGKKSIQALGSKKFELDELEREVSTNQSIYDAFYSQITQAKAADGLESANARVSDRAVAPTAPVKPRKQLIIAFAAFASLLVSVFMAFIYDQMDDTIKGTQDVEEKLGVPVLGIIPLISAGGIRSSSEKPINPMALVLDAQTAKKKRKESILKFIESVDTARTAIALAQKSDHEKVIMVTSSKPGEGKSTASLNLAYSLSKIERVLLIDCDLRKPSVAKSVLKDDVTRHSQVGLTELILGQAAASSCIIRNVFNQNLDVITAGALPANPLELIGSAAFRRVIEGLSVHYDRIVLDCAPIQAVSDAMILSRVSHMTVYCVQSEETPSAAIQRGINRLDQVGANIIGVLVTQVDVDKIASYGGDHYYQGHYDYYNYGSTEEGNVGAGKVHLTPEELHNIQSSDSEVIIDLDNRVAMNSQEENHSRQTANTKARNAGGIGELRDSPKDKSRKWRQHRVDDPLDFI